MKNSALLKIDTKKKPGFIILLVILLTAALILGFTYYEKRSVEDSFYRSVNYDPNKDLLSFTIPSKQPEGYKFYLHVSGRMFMGDKTKGMSFHAFDKESENYAWKSGKTYTYPVNSDNLDFIMLDFGLLDRNSNKLLYEHVIHISSDGTKTIN